MDTLTHTFTQKFGQPLSSCLIGSFETVFVYCEAVDVRDKKAVLFYILTRTFEMREQRLLDETGFRDVFKLTENDTKKNCF